MRPFRAAATILATTLALAGCGRLAQVGQPPAMAPVNGAPEQAAMLGAGYYPGSDLQPQPQPASLWRRGPKSLLGDRRARDMGDILTVVINLDEEAEIRNQTGRSRTGSEDWSVPQFLGGAQVLENALPSGATIDPGVSSTSSSNYQGQGAVRRNEKIELRVAATVVGVLPNSYLQIAGIQEVRVNFELRELVVSGIVRPEDISRQNEITYDKIAAARISYGGEGQISDVQQPRYGQQIADIVLPF
jgi:flagellar L-ring protein precursor FlgH